MERSQGDKCYDSRTHFNGYIIPWCCKIRATAVNYYVMLLCSQWSTIKEVTTAFCWVICCFIMAIELIWEAANDNYRELFFSQHTSRLRSTFTIIRNAKSMLKTLLKSFRLTPYDNWNKMEINLCVILHDHSHGILSSTTQMVLRTGLALRLDQICYQIFL